MKTKQTHTLIKGAFTLCLALFLAGSIHAQDKITLTNGEEIIVRVVEISPDEVKYKKEDNLEGPTHVTPKSSIFSVKYANGSTEVFGVSQKNEVRRPATDQYGQPDPIVTDTNEFMNGRAKKFSGPRLGLAFITNGTMTDYLSDRNKNPLITLMGWQFEQRIFTIDNGACGLIEFVPLVGGMEQGLFLPSANLLIGLRAGGMKSCEFAMGPNLSLSGLGMVFAGGANFRSGKINFPINFAIVPSVGSKKNVYDASTGGTKSKYYQTGWRFSITVGFNSRKRY